ncbi:TonB-dependent receptor [Catenovulum sp. 2E275]|uniref:TonB-dependent receptor n=1 Tax=Catenovulum sp. 2E275 TaxID=2980497 RepID=UPI0021CE9B28|nr:TonB-dependent receptor [Catenovulum sp. 2E275]MCU4675952.1 TonB-dependent receptor [Catenovulum sp. 2E275]
MMKTNTKFNKTVLSSCVLAALSLASYNLQAAEAEQAAKAEQEVDEVIAVRGIRGSLIKSVADKRFSGSIMDSISATDIGKLPDATIADSLQRVTGIQITRSGGEGTSVNIRGIQQVMTTLNGEQMLSAGSLTSIQPNFADIPSTMVSGIEAHKTAEAKLLSGGLSGTINLKTYRPFELDSGMTILGKAEAIRGSLSGQTDSSLAGFIGYNMDDEFGFTLNLSHADVKLADYNTGATGQNDGWYFEAAETSTFKDAPLADECNDTSGLTGDDFNNDCDLNDIYLGFQGHQAANRYIYRQRSGVNSSLQFMLTDAVKLTADVFYTKLDEQTHEAALNVARGWGDLPAMWFTPTQMSEKPLYLINDAGDSTELQESGNFYAVQGAVMQSIRSKTTTTASVNERESLNTNIELAFDNGGDFKGSVRWVHGKGVNNSQQTISDSMFDSGLHNGYNQFGENGEVIGGANPWGYDGQEPLDSDGNPVTGYTEFATTPVEITYTDDKMVWALPQVTFPDGVTETYGANMDRYSMSSVYSNGGNQTATLNAFRFDGNYYLDMGDLSTLDFGVRLGKRKVEEKNWSLMLPRTDAYGDPYLQYYKDPDDNTNTPTKESPVEPISFNSVSDYIVKITDFVGTTGLEEGVYAVDPAKMEDAIAFTKAIYGVDPIQVENLSSSYETEETTSTFYLQANLNGDLFVPYTANVGFRYIKTEWDVLQYTRDASTPNTPTYNGVTYSNNGGIPIFDGSRTVENNYEDFLPAINLSFDLTNEQKLRFSYTKTVTSQNTNQLGGGLVVNYVPGVDENGNSISKVQSASMSGNPELKPWRSTNYDMSYEWYFSDTGLFNLGVFFLDIESFNSSDMFALALPDSDGVVRSEVNTTATVNSEGGQIKGFEVGYQQGFDFLPGWLSGLGTQINYTYSPSESGEFGYYGESTPMYDNSEHQANFILWYEKDGLQARIATNYRSDKYIGSMLTQARTMRLAQYTAPTTYVDASISYDFTDYLTVSLQGTNLTEEYQEDYLQWEDLVESRNFNERRVTLGVQVRL